MATRATYQFCAGGKVLPVTLYIHHDGYPEGAAQYFKEATRIARGGLFERFLTANHRAELTESHEVHADTDYRYTVTGNGDAAQLTAYKRNRRAQTGSEPTFEVLFVGTVAEFVDKYQ